MNGDGRIPLGRMVVLPAASSPSIRIRASFLNIPLSWSTAAPSGNETPKKLGINVQKNIEECEKRNKHN